MVATVTHANTGKHRQTQANTCPHTQTNDSCVEYSVCACACVCTVVDPGNQRGVHCVYCVCVPTVLGTTRVLTFTSQCIVPRTVPSCFKGRHTRTHKLLQPAVSNTSATCMPSWPCDRIQCIQCSVDRRCHRSSVAMESVTNCWHKMRLHRRWVCSRSRRWYSSTVLAQLLLTTTKFGGDDNVCSGVMSPTAFCCVQCTHSSANTTNGTSAARASHARASHARASWCRKRYRVHVWDCRRAEECLPARMLLPLRTLSCGHCWLKLPWRDSCVAGWLF